MSCRKISGMVLPIGRRFKHHSKSTQPMQSVFSQQKQPQMSAFSLPDCCQDATGCWLSSSKNWDLSPSSTFLSISHHLLQDWLILSTQTGSLGASSAGILQTVVSRQPYIFVLTTIKPSLALAIRKERACLNHDLHAIRIPKQNQKCVWNCFWDFCFVTQLCSTWAWAL